ncbi:hypothetical protein MTsPCn5_09030 [Croceitalea sp. MTPC5]|jgi:uncharacterized protein YuzE|uniref:Lipocalin-like domain-containing protein n=4 Tax=Flagellimonas TaxID=444459 RepID=A0A371JVL1_9FLAO|nr:MULTISPECIES: hypothetical protein [Allomuricauda]GMN05515.1 hypothetical protein MTsPCn5_09030 [Croceitalea sp. MTPC5]MBO0340714.1 hypothetical protein [Allomuricauda profundi]MBO6534220.1 hypothetical protein [Allomuricauda sp.]MBO6589697.1 hypothetical protein [Allomuricauda sp.]MBO6619370.1 hypothetical protein [Allomuricauda sp.]|tara:strand:- start:39869 stop:40354 length:486 start_codon:yes stop_codon:yes gene_type:complete
MKIYTKVFLVLLVLLIYSCNNDDNGVSEADRAEALLGQWEYEAIGSNIAVDINGDGTVNDDFYNTNEIRQCLKDNLTFFNDRGPGEKDVFTINENGLSCGDVPAFQNVESDTYELINNEIIRFDTRSDWTIIEFTQNRLVVEEEDFLDDRNVIVTYVFRRS